MELDILINYSENNSQEEGDNKAWSEHFAKFLTVMLQQVLGNAPKIVLKSESDPLSTQELKQTGIMICIMTPGFVDSNQCVDAITEFKNVIGTKDAGVQRLFNVIQEEVPSISQPADLQDLLPYALYDEDSTGSAKSFTDYFGPTAENIYWMKMVDLVYDLVDSILELQNQAVKTGVKPLFERKTIYLAETTNELSIQRNVIKRELQRHGFRVLPDHSLPTDPVELQALVTDELDQSIMSIHLIGAEYGETIEGIDRSLIDLQNKLAAEKATKDEDIKLQRLIWINPNQENSSDLQKSFIENIQRDLTALESAEILQSPLEDFKNTVRDELFQDKVLEESLGEDFHVDDKKLNVYFIYDKVDEAAALPVKKDLTKAGLNVIEPEVSDNLLKMRNSHLEKLRQMDIGVIFRGRVNDNWTRIKLLDMLKAPGLGRTKPILGKAIIAGDGVEIDKTLFEDIDVEFLSVDRKEAMLAQIDGFVKSLAVAL